MAAGLSTNVPVGVASALLTGTLLGFCVTSIADISSLRGGGVDIAFLAAYTCALLVLQVAYFGQLRRYTSLLLRCAALILQACLAYLPLLQFGEVWLIWLSFLAGSILLALRTLVAVPLSALVVASAGWIQGVFTGSGLDVAHAVVSATVISLVVFGLTRFVAAFAELHAARDDLAKTAVADERLRFARDLHDLLGISLSAIILKSEVTHRLISEDPSSAGRELTEIQAVAQKAQADVRWLAIGHRQLSLSEECDSAESVLAAADIRVVLRREYGELSERTGTLLATVLREGVTNVLRHSRAGWCAIRISQSENAVSIELINDGATAEASRNDTSGGSGLRNLSERVQVVHGSITVEHLRNDWFRLHVSVPLEHRHQEQVSRTA